MKRTTLLFRRIHKWVGLILGLQFVVWAISGAMMAVLDMDTVAGGPRPSNQEVATLPASSAAWSNIQGSLGSSAIESLMVRPLLDHHIVEVGTSQGTRLFDAANGRPILVDEALARRVAQGSYAGDGAIQKIELVPRATLAIREHQAPAWRIDFADSQNSSFYVSQATGDLLERRNDTWRVWDFFWMLHNMDYVDRTSFNHPLIVVVSFGVMWLAITGLWLLFTTNWRPEVRALRGQRNKHP
jgi:uncharacterized iron-regulated membrane protein